MYSWIKLVRYQNLLMIALLQVVIRYGFLDMTAIPAALSDWQFMLLVLATVLIAAGGYIINDIFDGGTDQINKPGRVLVGKGISERNAYNFYVATNVIGVAIGFYLSNVIGRPAFAMVFIGISGLLYLYASSLKQTVLLGNTIIAILSAMVILIIPIFDMFPIITPDNRPVLGLAFGILLDYALFCFVLSLVREIVKDLEDVDGDYNMNMRTLPIVLGISRTVKAVFVLGLLLVFAVLYYVNQYYMSNDLYYTAAFTLFLVVGPLIYFLIKVWTADNKTSFSHLSNVLKLVMLFGILSILVVSYNISSNA